MKKCLYLSLGLLILIFFGFIAILLFLHSESGKNFLVGQLKSYLEENQNLSLKLDAVEFDIVELSVSASGLSIGSVSRSDLPDLLSVKHLEVELGLMDLLSARLGIERAQLEGVSINAVIDEEGESNLPAWIRSTGSEGGLSGSGLLISSLIAREGSVLLRDEGRGFSLEIPAWTLEVSGNKSSGDHLIHLSTSSSSEIRIRNKALLLDQFTAEATVGYGGVRLDSLEIQWDKSEVHMAGVLPSSPASELDAEIDFTIESSQLAYLFGLTEPVSGPLRGKVRLGESLQDPALEAEFNGEGLAWRVINDIGLSAGLEWKIKEARVFLKEGLVKAPVGSLRVDSRLAVTPAAGDSDATLQISDLRLGWLSDLIGTRYRLASSGTGEFRLSWPGLELSQFVGFGNLALATSTKSVRSGWLPLSGDLSFEATTESLRIAVENMSAEGLNLTGEAACQRTESLQDLGSFRLNGRYSGFIEDLGTTLTSLARLLALEQVDFPVGGRMELAGELSGTSENPHTSCVVEAAEMEAFGLQGILLRLKGEIDRRQMQIPQAHVSWQNAEAHISGGLDLRGPVPILDALGSIRNLSLRELGVALEFPVHSEGQARADFSLSGAVKQPRLTFQADVSDLQIAEEKLGSLSLGGEFENKILDLSTIVLKEATVDGGEAVTARGNLDFENATFSLKAHGEQLDISSLRLPNDWKLAGLLNISLLAWGSINDPVLEMELKLDKPSLSGYEFAPVQVEASLQNSRFSISALASSVGLSINASGQIGPPLSIHARAEAKNADLSQIPFLRQHLPDLTGAITGEFQAQGDPSDWRRAQFSGKLTDCQLAWQKVEVRNLTPVSLLYSDAFLRVEKSVLSVGRGLVEIEGSLPLETPSPEARLVGKLNLEASQLLEALPDLQLESSGELMLQAELTGSMGRPQLSGELRVVRSSLSSPSLPVPIRDLEAEFKFVGDAIRLEQLQAAAGEGTLRADGLIPIGTLLGFKQAKEEPIRISASLEEFPLESLGLMPERMTGLATAQVELTTPELAFTSLAGVAAFGELRLRAGDLTLRQTDPVLLTFQNGQLWIERAELTGPDSQITGSGGIDFMKAGNLAVKLEGSVSTTLLAELIGNFDSSGKGELEIVIGGLPGPPEISGTFAVKDGTLLIPSYQVQADEVELVAHVSSNQLRIESLSGELNGGSIEGDGEVVFSNGKLESLELLTVLTDVVMDLPKGLATISDGVLALRSTEEGLLLDGEIRVLEGAYRDRFDVEGALFQYLESGRRPQIAFQPSPFLSSLRFKVGIETVEPIIVDNNIAEAILQGRVELLGSYYRPGMVGVISVEPGGEIYLRGKSYIVEYGAISFLEDSRIRPELDVRARTKVQEYDVTLQAVGPVGALKTSFTSDPALAEPDIISVLLTGRTLEELRGAEASVAQEQALSLLAGAAGGQLGRQVENTVGITQVRIEPYLIAPESKPETRLTVGQDLTSDLRAIYSVNLADSGDQIWVAEYDVTRRFRTRGIKQADNTYRVDFNHRLRFPDPRRTGHTPLKRRVGTIYFEGNHPFSESVLLDAFKIRSGQDYDFFKAQKGLERVRELFNSADLLEARIRLRRAEASGIVDLTMRIDGGLKVDLGFEGDQISSRTREQVRRLWSRGVSDTQRQRESLQEIRRHLVQDGYLKAELNCEISFVEDVKRVTFQVSKGIEYKKIKLAFEGLEAMEFDPLRKELEQANLVSELFIDPTETTQFLESVYGQRGFLEVTVDEPVFQFDTQHAEVSVLLRVVEGPLSRVGKVSFQGNRVFSDQALLEASAIGSEDIYYPNLLGSTLARLEDFYQSHGYNRVQISDTVQRSNDERIDIGFQIEENVQDIVKEIQISGQQRVSDSFIEKQMGLQIGEVLDLEKVSRARKRLYDIGAFSLVEIEPVPLDQQQGAEDDERLVRLQVRVRETVPHRINYGAFFDTDRGPGVTVDYRNHNLLRNGRVLGTSSRFDGDRREIRGYFSEPARNWFPVRTYSSIVLGREFRPSFEFDEVAINVEQQAELKETLIASYGFSFARNIIKQVDPESSIEDAPLNIGSFNTALAWDTRDSFLEPTGGHFLSSAFKLAPAQFGSDYPFIKYFGGYSHYFPLTRPSKTLSGSSTDRPRLIFATWARIGLAKGFDQDMIPQTERFFAGGGTTIRGFRQDTVGPVNEDGVAIGGNSLFIWNNELRFPLFSILEGVGFLDMGNVYPTISQFNPLELREAAGFGLRVRTPFFLVRFDYGFKLDRQPGEPRGAFFFSIGQAF